MSFDAKTELTDLKKQRRLAIKKRYSISKLDKFSYELLSLKKEGATLKELQLFLKKKRIKVVLSTIQRWIRKHV